MAAIKEALSGTTVVTCTIAAAITNYAARESTQVVNTGGSQLYLDANLIVKIQNGGTAATGDSWILLSGGDGTNFTTPATGTDAAIVVPQIDKLGGEQTGQIHAGTNLIVLGKMNMTGLAITTSATAMYGSIAQAFGGNLLPQWGPVVVNATGNAYATTTANSLIWYDGVSATSV